MAAEVVTATPVARCGSINARIEGVSTEKPKSNIGLQRIDRARRVEKLNRDIKEVVESDSDIHVLGYQGEFPLE